MSECGTKCCGSCNCKDEPEVKWEFAPDAEPQASDDLYYDLFAGGYIKPYLLLKDQKQIDLIENAMAIVESFLEEAKDAGKLESV